MNNFGLSDNTIKILTDYFSKIPQIKTVKLYGSRALGTYRKGSDIDFAIFGETDKELIKKIAIEIDELETPYMFDITDYKTIQNKDLKEHIDRVGKIFFKR